MDTCLKMNAYMLLDINLQVGSLSKWNHLNNFVAFRDMDKLRS